MGASPKLLLLTFIFIATATAAFGFAGTSNKLHTEEVRALKQIGRQLGKRDWKFEEDPCSGKGNWIVKEAIEAEYLHSHMLENELVLYFLLSLVHLAYCEKQLKAQNLTGIIPPDFSKLRYLKLLPQPQLSHWFYSSTMGCHEIGGAVAYFCFVNLQLFHGEPTLRSIPKSSHKHQHPQKPVEFRLVVSLQEYRREPLFRTHSTRDWKVGQSTEIVFSFSFLVSQLLDNGSHSNLLIITLQLWSFFRILSSNAFTGKLPLELVKLSNLNDLRINDNNFSGKIPGFISKWKNIQKLHIQGCSLEGPIPSSISALTRLSDLRISDLKGGGTAFPRLDNMKSLKTLILRECMIHGEIPECIGNMMKLKNM
ncbi:hypothetical protein Patl1_02651 [Pistacia atlantica]|uniref:Uncharacterized protein n=1 Tax=Pistacia atlantica TaxID=434234 RepID=A0ACC1C5V0_9ROSI|nr:hypothetical protein Patl1_02651 [Pistacia atlantica]